MPIHNIPNLEPFDEKNIPLLVERVLPLWKVDGKDDAFNRRYVEMIIRTNMHKNEMQFQMCVSGELKAICFFAKKGDESVWPGKMGALTETARELKASGLGIFENKNSLSESDRAIFENGRRYLLQMEEKTFSLMSEADIKLCLFISLENGWGTKILNAASEKLMVEGIHNIYLWTDGECNVDWYFKNGFELVSEEEYKPFSRPGKPYMTYIFKKKIEE